MRAVKHIIGCASLATVVDYILFNGFLTDVFSQVVSQAYGEMLFDMHHFF